MADVVTQGSGGVNGAGADAGADTDTDDDASSMSPAATTTTEPSPATDSSAGSPPPFPRKLVNAIVIGVVALVLFVVVIDRVASTASGSGTTTTGTTTVHKVVGGTAPPPDANELHAPLRDLLDLTTLKGEHAAPFLLTDAATGKPVTLASLRGHVVLLSFVDADCKDICPVLAAELRAAATDLGKTRVPVSFVTVNTDPLATAAKDAAVLRQPSFAALPGWMFLTGSVHQLNGIWKSYGISITADPTTGAVTHNELLYFITPKGKLAWTALPFGDQSDDGSYSLPQPLITRFGSGIAKYAGQLAK